MSNFGRVGGAIDEAEEGDGAAGFARRVVESLHIVLGALASSLAGHP
jgi:hypothetical protein